MMFGMGSCIGYPSHYSTEETESAAQTESDDTVEEIAEEESGSDWVYNESVDEMTDKTCYYASIISENSVDFDFPYNGGSTLKLTLRDSPQFGKDAYIYISQGQFNPSYNNEKIKIRFDNNDPYTMKCGTPADFSTDLLFILDYKKLVKELKKAKTMKISASFFSEGTRTFTFNVDGLEWDH